MDYEKPVGIGSTQNSWASLRVAIQKRLRETGALVLIVGGAAAAPSASADSSSPRDASQAPRVSITDRIKRIRETSAGGADASNELGRVGPVVAAWGDHWRDHWNNIHWSNHWGKQHWSDHWNNHHR